MVKRTLVKEDIEAGKELIKALDEEGFEVHTALWYYRDESEIWRLIIASPFTAKNGPYGSYSFIQEVMEKRFPKDFTISLSNISVTSPNNSLIRNLAKAIAIKGEGDLRLMDSVIEGSYIKDALVYRTGSLQ